MATYYVSKTDGADGDSGLTEALAWETIAKVNGETFVAGDFILFNRGDTWREMLTVPSSGSAGSPITIGAYGGGADPIINGANLFTGWTDTGGNVYIATGLNFNPLQAFEDGARLTHVAWDTDIATTKAAMSAGTWTRDPGDFDSFWAWSTDSADPDTHTMEASNRASGVYGTGKSYITVQNLHLLNHKWAPIHAESSSDNWTVSNVQALYSYTHAMQFSSADNIVIKDSELAYSGGSGTNSSGSNYVISGNNIHDNSLFFQAAYSGHEFEAGLYLQGENVLVENNTFTDNGRAANTYVSGPAIWFDGEVAASNTQFNSSTTPSIIRYNTLDGNRSGIKIESTSYVQVYYNLIRDCLNDSSSLQHGVGLMVARNCHNNTIYNNTMYNNRINLFAIGTSPATAGNMTGNQFKNNICSSSVEEELGAGNGAENDGTNGSGNVYEYNSFGVEAANFIEWETGTNYSTYDAWEAVYGSSSNSVELNPLLINAGGTSDADYMLSSTSPCIDAGIPVGLSRDYFGAALDFAIDIGFHDESAIGNGIVLNPRIDLRPTWQLLKSPTGAQAALTIDKLTKSFKNVTFSPSGFEVIDVSNFGAIAVQVWGVASNNDTFTLELYGWQAGGAGHHIQQMAACVFGNFTSAASAGFHQADSTHKSIKDAFTAATAYRGTDTYLLTALKDFTVKKELLSPVVQIQTAAETDFPAGFVVDFTTTRFKYFGMAVTAMDGTSVGAIFKPLSLRH